MSGARHLGAAAVAVLAGLWAFGGVADTPYGVCSHVSRWGFGYRDASFKWIEATGIGRVRSDFDWWNCQREKDGPFDFTMFDKVLASAEAKGIVLLPILYGIPKWAQPVYEHLDEFDRYVYEFVKRYGAKMPEVEIWNEENIASFWKEPDPAKYLQTLSTAYVAAKRANPDVRVFFGGTAGVPFDFIGKVYELGGAKSFDVMNVHPYCWPHPPEGRLDVQLEKLRELMVRHGDGAKDLVITEQGWPTHDPAVNGKLLRAGLKVARPEKSTWNVVYATTVAGSPRQNDALAAMIEAALPAGSRVEVCAGARFRARLKAGDVDAVVYPFDETYPVDTFPEVLAFVKAGGTLVDFGGMPMWFPVSEPQANEFKPLPENSRSGDRRQLKIDEAAFWTDRRLPERTKAFPTQVTKEAGYAGDPAGELARRFLTPARLSAGDEFVPLMTAKNKEGGEAVAAAVVRFGSDFKGRLVLSGLGSQGSGLTTDETMQARYLVRAMAIAFAEGVKEYYWYEFRSVDGDPTYSEHNFGLTHPDFLPKPAWGAYRNFILRRPVGSVQAAGDWHDKDRRFFWPQWKRPDGVGAGLLWKTGPNEARTCRFAGEKIAFVDETGRIVRPANPSKGVYTLVLGERPLFFTGGAFTGFAE